MDQPQNYKSPSITYFIENAQVLASDIPVARSVKYLLENTKAKSCLDFIRDYYISGVCALDVSYAYTIIVLLIRVQKLFTAAIDRGTVKSTSLCGNAVKTGVDCKPSPAYTYLCRRFSLSSLVSYCICALIWSPLTFT